jgi:hypothetical protein
MIFKIEEGKTIPLTRRGWDAYGAGHFGAPRGTRKHRGIDFLCNPDDVIACPIDGIFTKKGRCYKEDPRYVYAEIEAEDKSRHRVFYCDAGDFISPKEAVFPWMPLGKAQDLTIKYKGIPTHVHYEIIVKGAHVNPDEYWSKKK